MKLLRTVPSPLARVAYAGNGVTTLFPVPFNFFGDSDLVVVSVDDVTAVETLKVLNTDYTVAGGDGATGSVTMLAAPASGTTLVIVRSIPYTQEIDYEQNDPFPAGVTEEGFDRNTMLSQQLLQLTRQSPKLPATYDPDNDPVIRLPIPVNGQTLVGNAAGTGWDSTPIADVSSAQIPAVIAGIADRDLLEYDASGSVWRNQSRATVLKRTLTTIGDMMVNIAGAVTRLAIGSTSQVLAVVGGVPAWVDLSTIAQKYNTGVIQTVQNGPVTTAGLPDFLPASSVNLNLTSQNVSTSYPFVVHAMNGGDVSGVGGRIGYSSANLTWTGLTASQTNYLYVTVSAAGVLTTGFTTVAPVYQWGGTPATTNGLITVNIAERKVYLGNGATAPQTHLVIVGHAVTSGSAVTSTVAYAYNGRYETAYAAQSSSVLITTNHNLGVEPRVADILFRCVSTEGSYSVGDVLKLGDSIWDNDGSNLRPPPIVRDATTIRWRYGSADSALGYNGAVAFVLTPAKWNIRYVVYRGW